MPQVSKVGLLAAIPRDQSQGQADDSPGRGVWKGSRLIPAIGAVLPAGLAVALSPFALIGAVLLLAGRQGRRNGLLFAAGWITGLGTVTALVVVVFGGADDPDSTSSAIAVWGRVAAGAVLIVSGARKWWKRPRPGGEAEAPRWMASLGRATAGRALLLGALLSGASPKNIVLAASAATSIVEAGAHDADLAGAVIAFVLVSSFTVSALSSSISSVDSVRHRSWTASGNSWSPTAP